MSEKVIARIPPSPTGYFHIGRARMALFNYLFAKKHGGEIVLRLEDTDRERSKKEYEEDIIESLKWLGVSYDSGPFRQSERNEVYGKYVQKMLDNGTAYVSQETEGQNKEVIRFKNPNKTVSFTDVIRGEISFDTTELKNFVIARNIGDPLYHLTVVIDDHEMGVTHIIRGEDHISNTPRQILLQEAIGAQRPVYAHLPMILAPDRSKMSARHGAVSVREYREKGYLPQAFVNYLALLGWNPGTEQEIFTMEELIEQFDLKKIQKGGAIFDEKKLDWVNRQHINRLPPDEKLKIIAREFDAEKIPELNPEKIGWKTVSKEETLRHLEKLAELIKNGEDPMPYAEREGKGNVLWPLRYALTGLLASPDPITIMKILGKEKSLERLERAIMVLNAKI